MNYFDTSYLVALVAEEQHSASIAESMAAMDASTFVTSHWALVEFASVLAREVRIRTYTSEQANQLQSNYDRLIRDSFSLILPAADDYTKAAAFIGTYESGLRGPDAMHLAIASNHGATAILSLDKKMIAAGRLLDLPISAGLQLPGYH